VLAEINERHGFDYVLIQRFAGGKLSGAYLVRGPDGDQAVLKWSPVRSWAEQVQRAAPAVARVRAAGWPTPAWLAVGETTKGFPYQVQEFAPGSPMADLGRREVALILDLVEIQAGLDPDPDRDGSQYVRECVFDNKSGYREMVRSLGVDGAAVVEAFERLCAPHRHVVVPSGDLVHGDLGTPNVLVDDNRLIAVIDVEALGSGTRVIDLASVLREGYLWRGHADALVQLHRAAEAIAGPEVLAICTAASVFAVLAFVAQHAQEELATASAGALRLAAELGSTGDL
jgi:aminoglycoside phosphotransferase (APT) family kinase protein